MIHVQNQLEQYDVVVCGGGPAGIGAAIACANAGQKTLLIEAGGCLGGTSTLAALPMMLGYTNGSVPFYKMVAEKLPYSKLPHPRRAVGGIYEKVMKAIMDEGGSLGPSRVAQTDKYPGLDRMGCHDDFVFDIEIGKRVFDRLAIDAGIHLRYYARVIDVERKNNRIEGIYFADKSGITYVPAKTVIDCTGDADVTYQAGFSTIKGDPETGKMSIAGLVAHVENVDSAAIEKYMKDGNEPWFNSICARARAEHPDLNLPDRINMFPMVQEGVFMINGGSSWPGYDGTDGESLTALTIRGRIEAEKVINVLMRGYFPGCENARLRLTAYYPGIRETRRIISEGALTEEMLLNSVKPNDTVALGGRHFDLSRENHVQQFASKGLMPGLGITPIPYSSMIPKGSENIIVAGRCIDAEGQALGPVRIMSTCMALGEAAGVASAMRNGIDCSYKEVSVPELRKTLLANDAEVEP